VSAPPTSVRDACALSAHHAPPQMQIIYGNSTIPPPTLLGTTAFSANGVDAGSHELVRRHVHDGAEWRRPGTRRRHRCRAVSGLRDADTEAIDFFNSTLYVIMDNKVTRMGSVGVVFRCCGCSADSDSSVRSVWRDDVLQFFVRGG